MGRREKRNGVEIGKGSKTKEKQGGDEMRETESESERESIKETLGKRDTQRKSEGELE